MTPDPATRARDDLARRIHDDQARFCNWPSTASYDALPEMLKGMYRAMAAALTEPPGRGPETGPDVETMRSELSRSYAVLMEAEAGIVETLDALTERPASQPMGPTFTRCRRCGGRGTVISDVKHGVACWFKNVAGQIERLQSLFAVGTAKTTPGSEAPATPAPDGPDGEPR